ncbi:cation transporter [Chryseotalea sanaruensis]|uniref:Cation transporter n=1 Tax=Chryseotalea sanaruensis TaxID=2482724 RepID=A0A401UDG2_9BACT|nr:cation diffusion facilitator family transporter [Chryseotalea sanaruensis]GCC52936.1 cation transporter [Chryseotalea sanaruensis]
MQTAQQNIRIQWWVAILSITLLLIKLIAYYLTHSVSILTDALEGIVNVVAGFVGLYSLYVSAKPRDTDHPYGHGKIEFISASLEGAMIFLAGSAILFQGVMSLFNPEPLHQLDIGILLVSITGVINFIVGKVCVNNGKKNNSSALIASGKHLLSDAYSTLAIIIGLGLLYFTQWQWVDSIVAIGFSFFILYTGFSIVKSSLAGIMDEADEALLKKLVDVLEKNRKENWIDLHNVRIIKYGSTLHLDCHLTVPWYLNVHEAHKEIDILAALVRQEFGDSLELFVHSDGCLDFSCKVCEKKDCPVRKHTFEKRIEWDLHNLVSNEKHKVN